MQPVEKAPLPSMDPNKPKRPDRYVSHALVEVRKFKNIPFFCQSAVLLDISLQGFKIEYTAEHKAKPGERFWLSIPLSPLGIFGPSRLICRGEVRWFDGKRNRMGGVFTNIDRMESQIIGQIVDTLQIKGARL